jgi:hypothetical protein
MKPTAMKAIQWIPASFSATQAAKSVSDDKARTLHDDLAGALESVPALLEQIESDTATVSAANCEMLAKVAAFNPERDALILPKLRPIHAMLAHAYTMIAPRNAAPADWECPLYWRIMQSQSEYYARAFASTEKRDALYQLELSKVYRDMALCVLMVRKQGKKAGGLDVANILERADTRAKSLIKIMSDTLKAELGELSDELAFFLGASA